MAFSQITLDTLSCGSTKYIQVEDQITSVLATGDEIRFVNELNGNTEATVAFFKLDGKGGSKIGGFCTEMDSNTLKVPKSTGADSFTTCTTTLAGQFAYEVEASPSHEPLDPVIIIDPSVESMSVGAQPGVQFSAIDVFAIASALFIGMFIGSYLGKRLL